MTSCLYACIGWLHLYYALDVGKTSLVTVLRDGWFIPFHDKWIVACMLILAGKCMLTILFVHVNALFTHCLLGLRGEIDDG